MQKAAQRSCSTWGRSAQPEKRDKGGSVAVSCPILVTMLLIFFLLTLLMGMSQPRVHPIILVPGDGGNSIEGRLNKTTTVHYICDKVSDWFTLWLNLEQLVPEVIA